MKEDRLYLLHMKECMERIIQYTKDGRGPFMDSTLIQDAVLRNLQTMAESSQHLSATLKDEHTEVNWRGSSGFRNVLVHNYLGVELTTVWQLIETDLPALLRQIGDLSSKLSEDEE